MSKRFTITITERPPVEFESIEDLKRHVDTFPAPKEYGGWQDAIRQLKPVKRRRRAKP